MKNLSKYATFIKFEHTLFSLPLVFAGAIIAGNAWPSFRLSMLILLAAGGARVTAMALNRIIDRRIDKKNPRTEARHLPSGAMNVWEAWMIATGGAALYLFCTWLISDFCLYLSWIPLVGFTAYPYFKRLTKWTHLGLGAVWALIPLAGFFAVNPSVDGIGPALLLAMFCVFWLAGFDVIYAVPDEEFDRSEGLFSLPAAWGAERALKFSALMHALAFLCLLLLYFIWLQGPLTVILLAAAGILLLMEQKMSRNVDVAFFRINVAIGFVVLFFIYSGIKGV